MSTDFHVSNLWARSDLCVQGTALRVKRLMLQGIFWLFLTWRWQYCESQMLLHVAMITQLSIWWFFDRPNSLPRRICPSDVMFCLFLRILTPNWAVLIRRPGGSVPVVRCSVFLKGSWFTIGPCNAMVFLFLRDNLVFRQYVAHTIQAITRNASCFATIFPFNVPLRVNTNNNLPS